MSTNVKDYGFYIEGQKLAIVERDTAFDNDVNSKDYGPGTHRNQWKSPLSSVTDGLEILYTYVPTYNILDINAVSVTIDQYYSAGGLLALLDSGGTDYSALGSGLTDGDYILLENAGEWSGLHQIAVSTGLSAGIIITNTTFYNGPNTSNKLSFDSSPSLYYKIELLRRNARIANQEILVPRYLEKAIIAYVKAKFAEDAGEFQQKEYFMREYRIIVEKHDGSLKPGAKIMGTPGPFAIR
tara:strand:+ start:240 stop:959 length:720 start_codon:yes stop_codon:yes gene_type:complete